MESLSDTYFFFKMPLSNMTETIISPFSRSETHQINERTTYLCGALVYDFVELFLIQLQTEILGCMFLEVYRGSY